MRESKPTLARARTGNSANSVTSSPSRRGIALLATLATAAGLVLIAPAGAHGLPKNPPHNPSDGQISAAQNQKDALATQVGDLSGRIAQATAELRVLEGQRELAEQKVALAISNLQTAQQAASQAKARVKHAEAQVVHAHQQFVQYLQASYMDGGADGTTTGSLLTASDPTALLDQSSLQQYQAENKLDAVGNLQRATVIKSNADAAARAAVQNLARKADEARAARQAADDAVAAQQAQETSLRSTLSTSRTELAQAQSKLLHLNHQRAAYVAYKKEQARLARIAARRAARRAARERARRLAAARAAARARARARAHQGGSPGGGGPRIHHGGGGHIAPATGGWTPAEAATAVRRVRSTLGTPYAWAGGNSYGPTYGVCDASNGAPNDCHVYGYDCSGLMMYGWGPYLSMAHYAATQYVAAGHYHPGANNLRPGDLVFWSFNGMISGIHHVAMYIGGGRIIEAPYSGGYVQVASLWEYGSFFGATRPLT